MLKNISNMIGKYAKLFFNWLKILKGLKKGRNQINNYILCVFYEASKHDRMKMTETRG